MFQITNTLDNSLVDVVVLQLKSKTNFFDYYLEEEYRKDIKNGKYLIWINRQLVVLGQLQTYPTGLTALSLTVVNYSDTKALDLQAHLRFIEDSARAVGVNRIILDGRLGWRKLFPDYTLSSVILNKEL